MLTAADCLSARAELAAEIALVRERDPCGHAAHALAVALAVLLQPIANAPANIGFGLMVGVCALRAHRLWRVWWRMLRDPIWALLVAWAVWTGITLFWGENPGYGIRQWGGFRAILWVPAIWPIMDRWRWLLGALLAGVACANGVQIVQYFCEWPPVRPGKLPGGGFHMYVFMGAWCAAAFAVWTMMAVSLRGMRALASVALASVAAIGLVIAGTRGSLVGAGVEVAVIAALLALRKPGWIRRAMVRAVVGLVILGAVWAVAGRKVQQKFDLLVVRDAATQPSETMVTPMVNSSGERESAAGFRTAGSMKLNLRDDRIAIWQYSIDQWSQSRWTGLGFGTILGRAKSLAAVGPSLSESQRRSIVELGHPHSTGIQTLAETGLIGLALYLSWIAATLAVGWCLVGSAPQACPGWLPPALLGAAVAFLVASQFDCYQMNSTAFAVGLIPIGILSGARWIGH